MNVRITTLAVLMVMTSIGAHSMGVQETSNQDNKLAEKLVEIRKRTVDENVQAIVTDDGGVFQGLIGAGMTSSVLDDKFARVVADPRLEYLHDQLTEMPEAERRRALSRIEEFYSLEIKELKNELRDVAATKSVRALRQEKEHGLRCLLFLLSQFATDYSRTYDRFLMDWHVWQQEFNREFPFAKGRGPDSHFIFHVYMAKLAQTKDHGQLEATLRNLAARSSVDIPADRPNVEKYFEWRISERSTDGEIKQRFPSLGLSTISSVLAFRGLEKDGLIHEIRSELYPDVKLYNSVKEWLRNLGE